MIIKNVCMLIFVVKQTCLCLLHLGLYPLILGQGKAPLCLPHLSPWGWGGWDLKACLCLLHLRPMSVDMDSNWS